MEFMSEQLVRAQMSYRLERRGGAVDAWSKVEGRDERVVAGKRRGRRAGTTRRAPR